MGIITFFAMLLSAAILLFIFGIAFIAFLKYSHKNSIYKRIKKRKAVIRISEADYSGEKIKELDIMLANYGYSFDITEMTASGCIVHVYRRK